MKMLNLREEVRMGEVVFTNQKRDLMKALMVMPGMTPFDGPEKIYIKKISIECRENGINPGGVADKVRENIHKYRHKKRLKEMEMARVAAAENAVIQRLIKKGLR